ncbi:MAG: ornithine cyclodeaminase family protein [Usitatibacter sp.]
MIHFTDAEVDRALEGADLEAALREAFDDVAESRGAQQARVRTDSGGVKLSTLGAVLPRAGVAGAKVYTTVGGEFSFLIALFSARTGKPLATFEANAITRRRTAAVSVLAAKACGIDAARTIAIFGTGVQGRAHTQAFAAAYPAAQLRIVGRTGDPRAALEGAQVVVTATRSAGALFDGKWVEPGTFVSAVGSSRPDTRELDDTLMSRAHAVVVEWKDQALREAGDVVMLPPALREQLNVMELGEVLAGRASPRRAAEDIVVFKSVGVGLEDVSIAGLAYRRLTGLDP